MLEEYKQKRDFNKTGEPPPVPRAGSGELVFVVQKHAARHMHYDFRLELDGVLKSWAIPNGPSRDPKVKRLAVMVEDHPLEYGNFEGSIPAGEYGGGEVIIWDRGTYLAQDEKKAVISNRAEAQIYLRQGLEKGKIAFELRGQKLRGSWALVRLQHSPKDWLLIKHRDEFAAEGEQTTPAETSVLSGLTLADLKAQSVENPATTAKMPVPETESGNPRTLTVENPEEARPDVFPDRFSPMLATPAPRPFSSPDWLFEPKLDGYRILAYVKPGQVKLVSRNGLDTSAKFPDVMTALKNQKTSEMVLDGEMVALDESSRPCFQCLQDYANPLRKLAPGVPRTTAAVLYYVFDILYWNGLDLRSVPLIERKKLLKQTILTSAALRLMEYFENEGESLYQAAVEQGLEGILAKRRDSLYEDGQRSHNWLKIKATRSEEFVIGGFTRGEGNREKTFGALLLGSYNAGGRLIYHGAVGTGFDDDLLAGLRRKLEAIQSIKNPFDSVPDPGDTVTWVKPQMVAEIKFAEKTREGYLRAPVFLKLRDDKNPREVVASDWLPEEEQMDFPNNPPLKGTEEILEQLKNPAQDFKLQIENQTLALSNLDKELWPAADDRPGVTKRRLLAYLAAVSPYMLTHLKDRPVTLTRYPNGIRGPHFFQRHSDQARPDFVETASLTEHENSRRDFLLCNNLATLLWLGQLATIDLHSWFSRVTPGVVLDSANSDSEQTPDLASNYPDFMIFDLDPYIYSGAEQAGDEPELNKKAFAATSQVALWLKQILDGLDLPAFVKTSGMTGLHIYVPIVRGFPYESIHAASKTISGYLLQKHPAEVTLEWTTVKRQGKVFLDYNQNARSKTLAAVYTPRHSPSAAVSAPLKWSEVGQVYPTDFTVLNLPSRLAVTGDLWAGILNSPGDLRKLLR